jgi:ArsR family transcriptional regulator, arsenate/arsenite/antimonite-responsive transcriptional repressor
MENRQLLKVAKALGDPTRFNILKSIASTEEICCGDLANRFSIAQATVSHHLKILLESGLIEVRREGQFNYCRAIRNTLDNYRMALEAEFNGVLLGRSGDD